MSTELRVDEYDGEGFSEPFRIENDEQANWAMRKYASIIRQLRANSKIADDEHSRIDAWFAAASSSLVPKAEYFNGLLKDYMQRQRVNDRKSIKLIHGTIKSRVTPARVEVDEQFVDWAAGERDDLIIYQQPKPNLVELKRLLQAGEPIPHAKIVEGGVSFSVEVEGDS